LSNQPLQSALLIAWRRPPGVEAGRGSWQVFQSAQLINWRTARAASGAGGGEVGVSLGGEADGVGNAQIELVGPPVHIAGEADGIGNAQVKLTVGATLRGEADGAGNAYVILTGGYSSITCVTAGTVGGDPPTPNSTVLYDAPSSW
jgi:hypothetical protein